MDVIVPGGTSLVPYVIHLQSQHREELGFLPRLAIQEYSARGQIIPAIENDTICGYMLYYSGRNGNRPRNHPDTLKIHQMCVQYDARRVHHALRLFDLSTRLAAEKGMHTVEAWVASDIDANAFWNATGSIHVATRLGGRKRNRYHNLWRYCIPAATTIRLVNNSESILSPTTQ